jgi:hypothetical protein
MVWIRNGGGLAKAAHDISLDKGEERDGTESDADNNTIQRVTSQQGQIRSLVHYPIF